MQFDAEEHKDAGYGAIPKGNYEVRIESVENKVNSKLTGRYLEFVLEVLGPSCAGRKLWYRVTISHRESEQAAKIGLGQLSALSRSVGLPRWSDERQLVGLVGEIVVGLDREDPTRNDVKGWVVRDKDQQRAPAANPHKTQQYGAPQGYPQQPPRAPSYPPQGYPQHQPQGAPQQGYGPPQHAPQQGYTSPYGEVPRRGMGDPDPALYENHDDVPF